MAWMQDSNNSLQCHTIDVEIPLPKVVFLWGAVALPPLQLDDDHCHQHHKALGEMEQLSRISLMSAMRLEPNKLLDQQMQVDAKLCHHSQALIFVSGMIPPEGPP
jgi:hypothetical protein